MSIVEISLTQGYTTVIDESDLELVSKYKWYALKNGNTFYAVTNVRKPDGTRTKLQLHKLLLNTPNGLQADHVDHDGLNNCRSNLRIVTHQQNQMNRRSQCGSSRFKGVSWNQNANKWTAQIQISKRPKYLGRFTSEQEAANAYNHAAKEYHKEFANLNNINTGEGYGK